MVNRKRIHIISGGTVSHIAPHLAICAPAYGHVGDDLEELCLKAMPEMGVTLWKTRMAGGLAGETNEEVGELIDSLVSDPQTKVIFMPAALVDFEATLVERYESPSWLELDRGIRLQTSQGRHRITLEPAAKLLTGIRRNRKDIFLVGFKNTHGLAEDDQYRAGLGLLKAASCNLVLANDTLTLTNMVITPEEARYHVTADRQEALRGLVEMTKLRSHLTFTRSTVVAGEPVPWSSDLVPSALRAVVDHCIRRGAYKPFRGATVGHFAVKLSETEFLTSQRKTDFNQLDRIGLVRIRTDGPDTVLAYGAKPSVGGQSQRIVFSDHPEYDCIVHFHCPLRKVCLGCHGKDWACGRSMGTVGCVPVVSQREFECGSHQCGQNTSSGLKRFGNLSCVMLDQHGPNIVFHRSIDPRGVIDFIEDNFDLEGKTGGYVS